MIYTPLILLFTVATQLLISPEAFGISQIVINLFIAIFTLFNFGLSISLARFIAEYRVKDIDRTMQFIRLFIWFQAFSGLLQVTGISIVAIVFFTETNYEYLIWLFVLYSIIQYPGWLSVFQEALKGFHQYNKVSKIGIASVAFQLLTYLIGAQIGLFVGRANPAIGTIMGVAIGIIIGAFTDDFLKLLLSGWMFSKVAQQMGFSIRDVFIFDISKEVFKETFSYGTRAMLHNFTWQIFDTINLILFITFLPGYSSLYGLFLFVQALVSLCTLMTFAWTNNVAPALSEGYFNDKRKYCKWIISNAFRTYGQYIGFLVPIIIVIVPSLYKSIWTKNYPIFVEIFVAVLICDVLFSFSSLVANVQIGTGHLIVRIYVTLLVNCLQTIGIIIGLYYDIGIWVLIWPNYLANYIKQAILWAYIHFKIIKLNVNHWQTWISTALAGVVYTAILYGIVTVFEFFLVPFVGPLVVYGLLFLMAIFMFPGPCFFFFWAIFGGFDENTLNDLESAVELSGPLKRVVRSWYRFAKLGSEKSKLFNKFPMDFEGVAREINELMLIKRETDEKASVKA